ncbi:MAG: ABC transporter ATP-binding protein [Parvibaculum sp.]|nr:ABC transporter ATP-binding protein [Parvibaculum sp.]
MNDSIIELKNVKLTLPSQAGPVNILRGIDLSVARGQTAGLVGPSGSGKSTLLMVLAGLERPSEGSVRVAGEDLTALNEDGLARFRRAHVGIVFQSFHLIPTMTALENVAIPLEFAGRTDAFARAEVELKLVGLGHRLTHYPGQLSGGEQQRVGIARAVVNKPTLLLADEPTGNLDPELSNEIMTLFRQFNEVGTTVMIATHDVELLKRMNKRVLGLVQGKLVHDGVLW